MNFVKFTKMALLTTVVAVSLLGAPLQAQASGGGPHVKVFDGANVAINADAEPDVDLAGEPAQAEDEQLVATAQESSEGPSKAYFVQVDRSTIN